MALKSKAAILDFGSGKIVGLAGEMSDNSYSMLLRARVENLYNGFFRGEWVDKKNTQEIAQKTLKQLQNSCDTKIQKIYIGVPGEFCVTAVRDAEVKFNSPHKINKRDIAYLMDSADNFSSSSEYVMISRSSVYFVLDGDKRVTDPLGMTATTVFAVVSFSFAQKSFCVFIDNIATKAGISEMEFISSCLAQSLYLVTQSKRDNPAVVIDVGYVTTSVSVVLGDGLVYNKAFSVGGGNITDDLSQVLEIDFETADELRKKIDLNLEFELEDTYQINNAPVNAVRANDIVDARIEDMAATIRACLDESSYEIDLSTPIYLSGGGLCYMRGGVNCLSKYLGQRVELAPVILPEFNQYDRNSGYGLLYTALKESKKSRSFWGRLAAFIGG